MRYYETEQFFKEESKLNEVLEKCQDVFDKIDEISGKLRAGKITTSVECQGLLQELGGIFAYLNPIYKIAEVEKKNRQERIYIELKMDIENTDKKFSSAPTEREASALVAPYRRVRGILEGYVEICKILIISCQSLLRALQEERSSS